jgi:hypothetical protein
LRSQRHPHSHKTQSQPIPRRSHRPQRLLPPSRPHLLRLQPQLRLPQLSPPLLLRLRLPPLLLPPPLLPSLPLLRLRLPPLPLQSPPLLLLPQPLRPLPNRLPPRLLPRLLPKRSNPGGLRSIPGNPGSPLPGFFLDPAAFVSKRSNTLNLSQRTLYQRPA